MELAMSGEARKMKPTVAGGGGEMEDVKAKKKEFREEERKQKETVKVEKKLEKKKNKEEKKRAKEEEREKERADKIREKEERRQAEKKREMRKERRKSFLKGGGGNFDFSAMEAEEAEAQAQAASEKQKAKKSLSPEVLKRQRALEQFLLNVPRKKLRGTTWMYYDVAPASGYQETVILLHGGGIRPEAMYEHILGIAQRFRVVAPWFPEYFTEVDDYVAGLILIMRNESIKRANFVGVGFGGIIATHFLYRHPGRVVNCALMYSTYPTENRGRMCEKALKKADFSYGPLLRLLTGHQARPRDIAEHVVNLTAGEREMWVNNFKKFASSKQALTVRVMAMQDYHTNFQYLPADMERFKGRMLLMESEDDEYFDVENFQQLQELFPNASVHYFNGTGHLFGLIRAQMVADRLVQFLDNEDETCTTSRTDLSARTECMELDGGNDSAEEKEEEERERKDEKKREERRRTEKEDKDKKEDREEKKKREDKDKKEDKGEEKADEERVTRKDSKKRDEEEKERPAKKEKPAKKEEAKPKAETDSRRKREPREGTPKKEENKKSERTRDAKEREREDKDRSRKGTPSQKKKE